MKEMNQITQRLYQAVKILSGEEKQADVARRLGIIPQTLANWEKRGPSKEGLIKAQKKIGVAIEWLETGKGQMHNTAKPSIASKATETVFDVLDVRAACGNGILNPDHPEIIRRLIMPSEKALELIGSANRNGQIYVIVASKDSMVPTINPNDLLFVDTSVREYRGESVYILLHGGELICKRLQMAGKTITVISDNTRYLP